MSSKLRFGNAEEGYGIIDEFYKSLMFQYIMDGDFSRPERDTLLVVFRKTLHYEKWNDRISMYHLGKIVGVGDTTLRITLDRLQDKGLIEVKRSKGGKSLSNAKYNKFSLSNYLINAVYQKWESIKIENGININYSYDD